MATVMHTSSGNHLLSVNPNSRTVLENVPSHTALTFGPYDVSRDSPLMTHQCNQLSDGCNLLIFVISIAGLTTNFGSLRLFIRDLVERRRMSVTMYYWSQEQHTYQQEAVRAFSKYFGPVVQGGDLGWGVYVPVAELIKTPTTDEMIWGMLEAFGTIDSIKAGSAPKDAAPKNRNVLTKVVQDGMRREQFFAAVFE